MLFNSFPFLFVFLPIALAGFLAIIRYSTVWNATAWVVLASITFYGYWKLAYVPILVGSILFNYVTAVAIAKAPTRAGGCMLVTIGVAANLALLGYFKYANFVAEFLAQASADGAQPFVLATHELPIGISFYTFLQIAFLVDVYTNRARYTLLDYSFFVSFFPHLIAGPLLHHREIIPQLKEVRERILGSRYASSFLAPGLALLSVGLAKKMILANPLGDLANLSFSAAAKGVPLSFFEAWGGASAYALQIYFDFSAYSDMAIGLGLMFGILLPLNFNSPYQATSIIEFWRRWHITLSRFLRDYLYIPLGGNRNGPVRQYVNVMVTMLLGGLWHGANLTFVLWGGLHGILLVLNHIYRRFIRWTPPACLAVSVTLVLVMFAWVPFRAGSFPEIANFYRAMIGANGIAIPAFYGFLIDHLGIVAHAFNIHIGNLYYIDSWRHPLWLVVGFAIVLSLPNASATVLANREGNWAVATRWGASAIGAMATAALLAIYLSGQVVFLYFQF